MRFTCRCGDCILVAEGAPIIAADCCCKSCRTAAARMEALEAAPRVTDVHGATPFVACRKDRVRLLAGEENLAQMWLKDGASTRRVIATCCNTPMFLEFEKGHWLSLYKDRLPEADQPPAALRTMTKDLDDPSALPDDVPNAKSHTVGFMWRLLTAWARMGFKAPRNDWGRRPLPSEAA
ncbi:GFA family protein [Celeribacter sp.]|uniref:GFA family protein n=1 Tax=Celeribacter sp. TaxID=1890673 RepID=UPI003A8CCDCC